MATISLTRNYQDGEIYTAADIDAPYDDIETFINVTKLNDDNLQNAGITGSTKLVTGSVSSAKLAVDSVTTIKILDQSVTTPKLADAAVTTVKILDQNVTTSKLNDLAVTTAKLADASVTAAKLATGFGNESITAIKTSAYVALLSDDLIRTDTTSSFTVTLFAGGAGNAGHKLKILKVSSDFNALLVVPAVSETIEGLSSTSLNTKGELVELEYDGVSNWMIVRRYVPSVWTAATFTSSGGFSSFATQTSFIKRVGDSLMCHVAGTVNVTTGAGFILLPTGIPAIDTAKLMDKMTVVGTWIDNRLNNPFGSTNRIGPVSVDAGTPSGVFVADRGTGGTLTTLANVNGTFGSGDGLGMDFMVPISGWNG